MPEHYDILIKGAQIVDGTGQPRFKGDVGIIGEKIAAVGNLTGGAKRLINAEGLVLSPGFAEPHSHAELNILQFPLAENLIMQGITTFIGGNCGHCRAPLHNTAYASRWAEYIGAGPVQCVEPDWRTFGEFLDKVKRTGLSVNFIPLVGHGAIRLAVMSEDFKRPATPEEIKKMKAHVKEALDSGAFGMSAGMDYEGELADPDAEIVELLKIVQERDGIYAPHTRNLDYRVWVPDPEDFGYGRSHLHKEDAWLGRYHGVLEAVETATLANKIRTHIAHFPIAYAIFQPHPAYLEEAAARATLDELVDKPRSQGVDISFNDMAMAFGYRTQIINSFYNSLLNIPEWIRTTPRGLLVERMKFRAFRDHLKEYAFSGTFKFGMIPPGTDPYWVDCFRVADCKIKEYEGKTMGEIARMRSPHRAMDAVYNQAVEAVFDILVEDPVATWEFILDKRFTDTTLEVFFKHPAAFPMIDSLSIPAKAPPDMAQAPLFYGGFPLFIDKYVKQKPILTLEEAIHRACYQPLQYIAKVKDRGVIREGAFADLIVFDFNRIRMTGTFAEPALPTDGMEFVIVNGQIAYEGKQHTGVKSGKVLRHN